MRIMMTSLGTWDSLDVGVKTKHHLTYPLALVRQTLVEGGFDPDSILVLETEKAHKRRVKGPYDLIMISALDSRHFWDVAPYLRDEFKMPVRWENRGEEHPPVVIGGQSCYNPFPILPFVDVAYVGEAEVSALEMTKILTGPGTKAERLAKVAELPGCYVPSVHGYEHEIQAVYAEDAGLSIRTARDQNVNTRRLFRVEIARGCPHRCPFCVLGWRQPYRPMPTGEIIAAIEEYAKTGTGYEVHLQAGDAEAHPGIMEIRAAVKRLKLRDQSWTGRLDTTHLEHADPGKQYAFGIEGISQRLRERSGKKGYSNEFIAEKMEAFWKAGAKRLMFHFIGGLPTESDEDQQELEELFMKLDWAAHRTGERQYLQVGRQPFGPMPHTPWQRKAPGLQHDRVGKVVKPYEGGSWLCVLDREGQRYMNAMHAAIPMRGGLDVSQMLEDGPPRVSVFWAEQELVQICKKRYGIERPERFWGEWPRDLPLPWSKIKVRVR